MKIHKVIKKILLITGVLLTPFLVSQVTALSTDKEQPIEIEADTAELDDITGITIYTGNVIVIQGSMTLRGNKLTITYADDNSLDKATMVGKPATFNQQADANKGEIDGEGIKIDYLATENKLVMTENAELTQSGKLFRAYKIEYDTELSKMIARKAETGESTPSGKAAKSDTGRIKVILPPKKKTEE